MISLNKIWSKIEKPAIYSTLFIYIILKTFSLIFKCSFIDNLVEGENIFLFIAIILLFLIIFIDRRVSTLRKYESVSHFITFDEAIAYGFKQQKKIKKISILGHSTHTLLEQMKLKLHGNEELEILVRNPMSSNFLSHLKNADKKEREKQQITNAVNTWKRMLEEREIKNLNIYYYDFEPSLYLIIIDRKICVLGIFKPSQKRWGYIVESAIVIDGRNEVGKLFLDDLICLFESLKNISAKI